MLEHPYYALTDVAAQRAIVEHHPWALLMTAHPDGPVVSHLPVLLEPDQHGLTVRSHVARDDAALHGLGDHEVVLVFQGPHGYVSPSFYVATPYVPTWNFVVLHLHGRPELLDAAATYEVLNATVDHFESARDEPWRLASVADYADDLARFTVGFRLRPHRIVAKAKMSQDKDPAIIRRVVAALDDDPHHADPDLAAYMRRLHDLGPGA